jgi:hypothetical protein
MFVEFEITDDIGEIGMDRAAKFCYWLTFLIFRIELDKGFREEF